MNRYIITLIILICSCKLPVHEGTYEEKYTLFGNLDVFVGLDTLEPSFVDTVYFSISSPVGSGQNSEDLYISDAQISLSGVMGGDTTDTTIDSISFVEDTHNPGKYYPPAKFTVDQDLPLLVSGFYLKYNYKLHPGNTYTLSAIINDDTISAHTTIPNSIAFNSQEGEYRCEGDTVTINEDIELNNVTEENLEKLYTGEALTFQDSTQIDTISLRTDDCYVGSFASQPYFFLDFEAPQSSVIRTITYALDKDSLALESDILGVILEPGDVMKEDLNCNGINDSVYANLFYNWPCDESEMHMKDIFKIWKGHYYDSANRLYFENPFIWAVETTPIPMMWLYFNYYGLQLIFVQATDENYYEYLRGDPLGQNQQVLPDTNIEGGYGLFSSTISSAFFIYTQKAPED